jgi:hypothetical protein
VMPLLRPREIIVAEGDINIVLVDLMRGTRSSRRDVYHTSDAGVHVS